MMATRGRAELMADAIACFYRQTWASKELIIRAAGEPAREAALALLIRLGHAADLVKVLPAASEEETLGGARNRLLEAAAGEIVCQWDDDDLNHPERLARQARHLLQTGADASFFTEQVQYFSDDRTLHYCDWARNGTSGWRGWIPGTLMMRRSLRLSYPEDGPFSRRHEDTVFMQNIAAAGEVALLREAGELYIYRHHGGNVFAASHHRRIVRQHELDPVQLRRILPRIEPALKSYALPRPCRLAAMGDEVAVYR